MRTAKAHIPLVDGIYSGRARCYELDPPLIDPDNGVEQPFVTVVVQPGHVGHQLPEVHVFAAEPQFGGPVGYSMQKLPGSCTLYSLPDDPEDGWRWALMQLGVTAIV